MTVNGTSRQLPRYYIQRGEGIDQSPKGEGDKSSVGQWAHWIVEDFKLVWLSSIINSHPIYSLILRLERGSSLLSKSPFVSPCPFAAFASSSGTRPVSCGGTSWPRWEYSGGEGGGGISIRPLTFTPPGGRRPKLASTDGVGINGLPVEDEKGRVGPESRKNLLSRSASSTSSATLRLIMPCRSEGEGRLIVARGKPVVFQCSRLHCPCRLGVKTRGYSQDCHVHPLRFHPRVHPIDP